MHVTIFGRNSCPFCVRAKDVATKLSQEKEDFTFRYVDIIKENISKADLEHTIGKPVLTVPQIFVGKQHVGGFTEFEAYAKEHFGLYSEVSA